MRPPLLIALIACLASPTVVAARSAPERDFCADRPGKGTPTCILDKGRWQVELGLFDGARQTDGTTRTDTWDAGDLFVRYGLTGLTELQLGLTTWNRERILDRATGEIHVGKVPPYSVVVAGSLPGKPFPDGTPGPALYCAVIVKQVDAQTRSKTGTNELLRD